MCLQCVLGPPVHPHPPGGAGVQPGAVASGRQPAEGARHLLLLQRHGALHQRAGPADRGAQGQHHSGTTHASDQIMDIWDLGFFLLFFTFRTFSHHKKFSSSLFYLLHYFLQDLTLGSGSWVIITQDCVV